MPATRDILLTKIAELELQIEERLRRGEDTKELQERLLEMKSTFVLKNEALSKKVNILKG